MKVEVAYAIPEEQVIFDVYVEEGATAQQAIEQSGVIERFPDIDLTKNKIGIFGHAKKLDQALEPGDRVEVYRPITCDPKEVRRQRAALAKENQEAK